MARRARPLTAREVTTLKQGVHADGGGLFLIVQESGARSWQARYQLPGAKRRSMGLGAVDRPYSLAEARERNHEIQKQAKSGIDPLAEKQKQQAAAAKPTTTFRHCAEQFIASRRSTWKNAKHADQWSATLERYAYPLLGDMPVQNITVNDVVAVLLPIWETIPETANRVRSRIELTLEWAESMDYRPEDSNPARWRGKLRMRLPCSPTRAAEAKRLQAKRDEHFNALPWQETPDFVALLRQRQNMAARALEFTILTAARTGMTQAAEWTEINLQDRVWIVPAARMKMGKAHRIPLSAQAMAILTLQKEYSELVGSKFVFPGLDPSRPMSVNTMYQSMIKYMKVNTVTVHGFRSTFRQWIAEATKFSREAAEMALAHTLGGVEAAYQRSDLLEERRHLMEAWARFIAGEGSTVIEFPARRA